MQNSLARVQVRPYRNGTPQAPTLPRATHSQPTHSGCRTHMQPAPKARLAYGL